MKALAFVLIVSLVGNAAWIVLHFREVSARDHAARGGEVQLPGGESRGSQDASVVDLASGSNEAGKIFGTDGKPISPKVWSQLFGGDLKGLVARLKAAGFPSTTIRAIVLAEVGNQFSERRKDLLSKMVDAYWRSNSRGSMNSAALNESRTLQKEYAALVKDLLSELPPETASSIDPIQQRRYGNLSPEKMRLINRINSDYGELSQEIHINAQGLLLPEDREKLAFLEKEKQADIENLLTPAERLEYELRSSPLANSLRGRFNGFEPSEAEFRAIYSAAKLDGNGTQSNALTGSRGQNDAIPNAIKSTLTPERYAEYQRLSNPSYATANRLAARLSLPEGTADRLVAIERDTQNQAAAIRGSRGLTAEQRTAQLNELAARATQQLTSSLGGDRGMEAYRQYGGGWLRSLTVPQGTNVAPAVRLPGR